MPPTTQFVLERASLSYHKVNNNILRDIMFSVSMYNSVFAFNDNELFQHLNNFHSK